MLYPNEGKMKDEDFMDNKVTVEVMKFILLKQIRRIYNMLLL